MELYDLPKVAVLDGITYEIATDFREILRILRILCDSELPALFRYYGALAVFYKGEIPENGWDFLSEFVEYGCAGGQRRMDWQQDADAVMADVSKVAGQDVRGLPYLHWWSFLALFQGIGEGLLSLRIAIRDKLRRGQKLEPYEQAYLNENRDRVVLKRLESFEERLERKMQISDMRYGCGKGSL